MSINAPKHATAIRQLERGIQNMLETIEDIQSDVPEISTIMVSDKLLMDAWFKLSSAENAISNLITMIDTEVTG
jgi:hypothetical protein